MSMWKRIIDSSQGRTHQTITNIISYIPLTLLVPPCFVHKRPSSSKNHLDSLKAKTVEEVLAEIKKKKATPEDDVASAGPKIAEQLPEEAQEQEEDEEGEVSAEDKEEKERPKWRVTHGYHMVRGKMDHGMEDRVVAKKRSINDKELGLYAIFDGHAGCAVAEYLQKHLFDNILNQTDFWEDPESGVKKAYSETDEEILEKVSDSRGGSTAVTAILINCEKLIVANVGDSRGIICKRRDIEQVTVDHDPETEKELVESRGGYVSQTSGCVPRVDGQLNMSRAFGDGKLKEHITSEPDITIENVDKDVKFIILASDGLWKVMSNEEACECVRDLENAQEAAEELIKEALYKRSMDDISCIVVMFHGR